MQACSRHEGASVVVIKNTKNVAKCAWLGELDSAEESDEISSEFDFQQEMFGEDQDIETADDVTENVNYLTEQHSNSMLLSENSRELHKYLENIEKWSVRSRKTVIKKLLEQIVHEKTVPEEDLEIFRNVLQKHVTQDVAQEPRVSYVRSNATHDGHGEDIDDDEDDLGDVVTDKKGIDHFFDNGKFNQKNQENNKVDRSNEEVRSSWSSSEEALAACEGAIFNIALNGATSCTENATFDDMRPSMSNMSYITDTSGK